VPRHRSEYAARWLSNRSTLARRKDKVTFADKALRCRECEADFSFTAGEQAFFAEKGLVNEPQRCPDCRAVRRRERLGREPRAMHAVVCATCGAVASVPFLPRYDRPGYCASCFEQVRVGAEV
jgi:CxxC-x17-CxxC domain-containing protein